MKAVSVSLEDLNGPRGGIDKSCSMQARLAPRGSVRVEDTDSELPAAVDRAATRLARAIARALSAAARARVPLAMVGEGARYERHACQGAAAAPRAAARSASIGCRSVSAWHTLSVAAVLDRLGTTESGLSTEEAPAAWPSTARTSSRPPVESPRGASCSRSSRTSSS